MNNENESEKMARAVLDAERYHRKALCLNRVGKSRLDCICESLYAAGYGDKKQAVKEFAEKLKASFYNMEYSAIAIDNKIDNLITELYGAGE